LMFVWLLTSGSMGLIEVRVKWLDNTRLTHEKRKSEDRGVHNS
jgi:hypothetical protein